MPFVHLHVHSHYSLLNALPKIDPLLDQVKDFGMDAVALTDTSNMYGAVEFFMHARDKGIKAIIGVELYVAKDLRSKTPSTEDRRRHTIVLLAKDETGYKNLLKLITIAQLEGFYYKPRVDKATLRQYHEGLIALSGGMTGEVAANLIYDNQNQAKAAALEYADIFGEDHFYLELGPNVEYENQVAVNRGLRDIAEATGIPLVAASDVYYLKPENAETYDLLLCIQNNRTIQDENRPRMNHLNLSLRSPEEMAEIFRDVPDAIENTGKIAERCNVTIKLGETQLPHYDVPDGLTADAYLRNLCEASLKKRYGDSLTQEYRDRLEYELDIIGKTGFASYFLIVQDFVNWARADGVVVGPGRGSAAGSFVAYLTGITNIDPIKYTLLFERFLNPERISMPDVDMDFADDRRDDVLDYVRKRYGADHVAQIITFGTMAAKAAVRDTGRALGLPYSFCDQISKLIPMFTTLSKAVEEIPDLKKLYDENPDAKRIIDAAKELEGNARHASVHACGVVITKDPVVEYSPLQNVSGHGEGFVTQYASSTKSSAVEKIGLLKMDFLGLKNLTIIQNTVRIIRALGKFEHLAEKIGVNAETASVSDIMDHIPLDDDATYQLLQEAKTTGVFQLESSGMKRYLKELKPTVFEDIIAMVALYRPGPMDWIPDFIDGKHGRKEVKYLHPKLEPILRNTYGVAVYQEQVMQIARDLAGFTLGEADVLRKAMGKKIRDLIDEQHKKFVDRAETEGVDRKVAEKVFAYIEPFAGYGFNRSHAACYGLIGYQTAFLKAHYPAEFMAALLTSDQSDTDRIAIEVSEGRELGVETLPPTVNESFEDFAVIRGDDNAERIRFGLNAIKNVGRPVAEEIVRERKAHGKYVDLEDFLERVRTKDLNKKSFEALAKVGALDEFGERKCLLENTDSIISFSKNVEKIRSSHEVSLFGGLSLEKPKVKIVFPEAPATKRERLAWEKELLGLYISDHPLTEYADYLRETVIPIHDMANRPDDAPIRLGGIIFSARKIYAKNGSPMFFIGLEDMTGKTELVIFPRLAEKTETFWQEGNLVIVDGKISRRDGDPKCMADAVTTLSEDDVRRFLALKQTRLKHQGPSKTPAPDDEELPNKPSDRDGAVVISIDPAKGAATVDEISKILKTAPEGKTPVFVLLGGTKIQTSFTVGMSDEMLTTLRGIDGVMRIKND